MAGGNLHVQRSLCVWIPATGVGVGGTHEGGGGAAFILYAWLPGSICMKQEARVDWLFLVWTIGLLLLKSECHYKDGPALSNHPPHCWTWEHLEQRYQKISPEQIYTDDIYKSISETRSSLNRLTSLKGWKLWAFLQNHFDREVSPAG